MGEQKKEGMIFTLLFYFPFFMQRTFKNLRQLKACQRNNIMIYKSFMNH